MIDAAAMLVANLLPVRPPRHVDPLLAGYECAYRTQERKGARRFDPDDLVASMKAVGVSGIYAETYDWRIRPCGLGCW